MTVSRDVDMKRKVDASSVIQSLPHPAAATTQQGEKEEKEKKGSKVVAPGSLAGPRAELLGRERSLQL